MQGLTIGKEFIVFKELVSCRFAGLKRIKVF